MVRYPHNREDNNYIVKYIKAFYVTEDGFIQYIIK